MAEKSVLDFLAAALSAASETGGSLDESWFIYDTTHGQEKKDALLVIMGWAIGKGDQKIIDRVVAESMKLGIHREALKLFTKGAGG